MVNREFKNLKTAENISVNLDAEFQQTIQSIKLGAKKNIQALIAKTKHLLTCLFPARKSK